MGRAWWFLLLAGPLLASARANGRPSPSAAVQSSGEQLRAAGEKDEAAHDKAGCFCKSNLAEKQSIVDNMQQQLTGLGHDIDEQTAKIGQLDVEVKMHQDELDTSSKALSTAEALRKSDFDKFTEEEQSHSQSIDQLQSALTSLKGRSFVSTDIALATIKDVTRRSKSGQPLAFVQLRRRLRSAGSNSPAVVTGVIEHMVTSFSNDLQTMRDDEIEAKSRHEGLVSAKSSEITSQKRHILAKSQRLAKTKVDLNFKSQIQTRSQKVLDANTQVLIALKKLCQRGDDSFEARREALQAEFTALAGAQADISGAQLLSVSQTSRGDGGELLCGFAPEIVEKDWREQASAACKTAKTSPQNAAEAVEELEADIRQAQNEASRQQDDCSQEIRGAQVEGSVAEQEQSAEANFVNSAQKDAEEQIEALKAQSDSADKAKADYQDVTTAQNEAFQALRIATSRGEEALNDAANRGAGKAAAMKISEAVAQSEKLMGAVNSFAGESEKEAQELASLLDGVRMAAGKALIPLQLMKADSEESAINIKEEGESRAHARKPTCDATKLAADVARLSGYRRKLGKAAEGLAWETLR